MNMDYFFVEALSFVKSTQIMSFSFFLSTTTIGDNQVASSTCLIKPTTSNLSISYLIITS
jgi:hypothetical protein